MAKELTPEEREAKIDNENQVRNVTLSIGSLKKNIEYYNSERCLFRDEDKKVHIKACEDEIKMWENKIKTLNGEKTDGKEQD